MSDEMKPAYLIAGTDRVKADATRARLRARAESETGGTGLELFEPAGGRKGPDADAVVAAIPAMSLAASRRYLLVDGVEGWNAAEVTKVAAAVAAIPPDTTIVLIARGKEPAKKLAAAVEGCGGQVLVFEAPGERGMPRWVVDQAVARGFRIDPAAARLLVDRLGANQLRLANELDRLELWAGSGGEVTSTDLEAMIADTSEAVIWSLCDALVERDPAGSLAVAERLVAQEETIPGIVYRIAGRLREAHTAAAALEAGTPPKQVQSDLKMHPYAARKLVERVRDVSASDLREAICAVADLELWSRGGSDYEDRVALTMALRRAAGGATA